VDGALAREYSATFPLQAPPRLVIRASLLWGKVYAYERRPEYVKLYGKTAREDAQRTLENLVAARQYLTDALGISETPANVGGVITNNGPRIWIDGSDGTYNAGDF
jgi:hypothetical protein